MRLNGGSDDRVISNTKRFSIDSSSNNHTSTKMTQYREIVEKKRVQQKNEADAKKWAKGIKFLLAENGYIKTKYNSGKVVIVYHRDFENHKAGDIIIESEGNSLKTIISNWDRWRVDMAQGSGVNEW